MKTRVRFLLVAVILLTLIAYRSTVSAQGTAFTYQGRLNSSGVPANGANYSMVFYLYDAPIHGNLLGNEGIASVTVSNGLFTVPLDFSNVFDGNPRWLEVSVEKTGPGGDTGFTTLSPRQQITPAPYAIFANTAGNVSGTISSSQLNGSIATTNISGTLPLAQLPAQVVTNQGSGYGVAFSNVLTKVQPAALASYRTIGPNSNCIAQLEYPGGYVSTGTSVPNWLLGIVGTANFEGAAEYTGFDQNFDGDPVLGGDSRCGSMVISSYGTNSSLLPIGGSILLLTAPDALNAPQSGSACYGYEENNYGIVDVGNGPASFDATGILYSNAWVNVLGDTPSVHLGLPQLSMGPAYAMPPGLHTNILHNDGTNLWYGNNKGIVTTLLVAGQIGNGSGLTNVTASFSSSLVFTCLTNVSAPAWWGRSNTPILWSSNNPALTAVPNMYRTYYDAGTNAHTSTTGF